MGVSKQGSAEEELTRGAILAAFEKMFSGAEQGVRRFSHSGVRHVALPGGAELVEQNPRKASEWAKTPGHTIEHDIACARG
ncbi:MAG: hypothetical protein LC785_15330 [Acidobacteria bacterium]|nr:hypothetical protein [Acidobacteriota bacterium]